MLLAFMEQMKERNLPDGPRRVLLVGQVVIDEIEDELEVYSEVFGTIMTFEDLVRKYDLEVELNEYTRDLQLIEREWLRTGRNY